LDTTGAVSLHLDGYDSDYYNWDTYLALYDSSGTYLTAADDTSSITGNGSWIDTTLDAGTYYVVASGYANEPDTDRTSAVHNGVPGGHITTMVDPILELIC
jgi:hypothetical protein